MFENLEPRQMLAADVYTVNTLADVVDANDDFLSLREALVVAATDDATDDGDIINFETGLSGEVTLTGGQLVINSDVNVLGPGSELLTIDGNDASRVFQVNSGVEATLSGLTIRGGYVTGYTNPGAGIYNQGTLHLDQVAVTDNHAFWNGGGLFSDVNASLTVESSTFDGNSATYGGGARIYTAGSGEIWIRNSTFSNNEAENENDNGLGSAGAIYVWGGANPADVEITNSTFSGNHAALYTGGVRAQNGGSVLIVNSTIIENTAGKWMGGIGAFGAAPNTSSIEIVNSIIAGNTDDDPLTSYDDASGNIHADSSYNLVGVTNSSALNDTGDHNIIIGSADPDLAPLDNYGGPTATHALLANSPAIDKGNTAEIPTGVSTDQRGFARVVDDPSTANGTGGAVDIGAFEYSTSDLIVTTLADSGVAPGELSLRQAIALAGTLDGPDSIEFAAGLAGGTITLVQGKLIIDANDITILGQGVTIDAHGQSYPNFNSAMSISDSTVHLMDLTITGGETFDTVAGIDSYNSALTLERVKLLDNFTWDAGVAGIRAVLGSLTLIDSHIDDNRASMAGSGVYTSSSDLIVTNSTVSNNYGGSGGGIAFYGGPSNLFQVTNTTVSGNNGGDYVGIITSRSGTSSTSSEIINSTIYDNTAMWGSAGVRAGSNAVLTLHNTIVAGSTVEQTTNDSDLSAYGNGGFDSASSHNLIGYNSDPTGTGLENGDPENNQVGTNPSVPLNPLLAPLDNYGGPTRTHALLPDSPAIDGGNTAEIPTGVSTDQRGFVRVVDDPSTANGAGGAVDIGAFEYSTSDLIVTTLADSGVAPGELSLRQAIALAETLDGPDTIEFDPSLAGGAILLTQGSLTIDSDVTIVGLGADLLTIDAQGNSGVFYIESDVTGTLQGLRITGGNSGIGGAIYSVGSLTIDRSRIDSSYAAAWGGGISHKNGDLTITNSTIDHNETVYLGGGLYVDNASSATIVNSTISGNSVFYNGGGIFLYSTYGSLTNSTITENTSVSNYEGAGIMLSTSASMVMHNSIVAGNVGSSDVSKNGGSSFYGSSHNLIGIDDAEILYAGNNNQVGVTDPKLSSLGNYGGPTPTHALLPGSVAIDAGDPDFDPLIFDPSLNLDQRGLNRVADGGVYGDRLDIGAYEVQHSLEVDTLADEDDGDFSPGNRSLREALTLAANVPGLDTITFAPDLFLTGPKKIALGDTDGDGEVDVTPTSLVIDSDVTIVGPGSDLLTIDTKNSNAYGLYVYSATTALTVRIQDLQVTGSNTVASIINRETLTLDSVAIADSLKLGIYNYYIDSDLTLIDSEVSRNLGGGIKNYFATLRIMDSTIADNSTSGSGGGIFNYSGDLNIERTTIAGNSAGQGGGVANLNHYSGYYDATFMLIDSTVSGNFASSHGGGIFTRKGTYYGATWYDPNVTTTIQNSTISSNTSGTNGGGIYLRGADLMLTNVTIAENKGTGGGLHSNAAFNYFTFGIDGMLHSDNTIIAKNTLSDGTTPSDVVSPLNFTSTSSHNLIGDATDSGGLTHDPGNGTANYNIVGIDPLLKPLGDNGGPTLTHALSFGSPAIDAGSNAAASGLIVDQRGPGFERNISHGDADGDGSTVDIGAVEWPGYGDLIVNTLSDGVLAEGELSLREAIVRALPGQIISFSANLDGEEIQLARIIHKDFW